MSLQCSHKLVLNTVNREMCAAVVKWNNIEVGWGQCLHAET
jgi:hypothetical protein